MISSAGASSLSITALIWDQTNQALFASAGDNIVNTFLARVIVTNTSISVYDTKQFPAIAGGSTYYPGTARAMYYSPSTNLIYAATDQAVSTNPVTVSWNQPTQIYRFRFVNCAQYTCAECGVKDPSFCGYCSGADQCSIIASVCYQTNAVSGGRQFSANVFSSTCHRSTLPLALLALSPSPSLQRALE